MRNLSEATEIGLYRPILVLLCFVFFVRILAQYLQLNGNIPGLPPFELWHSETMPYSILLALQVSILCVMVLAVWKAGANKPRRRVGHALLGLAVIYAFVMLVRMVIGVLDLSSASWFDGAVSTAFHFILAAYLLTLGALLTVGTPAMRWKQAIRTAARYIAYPTLIIFGYAMFAWLRASGAPLLFSSYLSTFLGIIGVILLETLSPARNDWRPVLKEVLQDGLFVAIVQLGIPATLKALTLLLLVRVSDFDVITKSGIWPHEAPILLQIALMMIIAEFFRYWIHRTLHSYMPLWKLHAVHHASDKLYTINVGRFHPFDKAIQFLGDTAPFLLLGVHAEVFAAYFVLYAINGFFQHSNADVRLGVLNYIIAGPELHRWHHSAKISEANANYGNNLIVWDAVFGTRFLPRDREVGRIGIGNPDWPNGFWAQMSAPFTNSTDASDR